MFIEIKNTHDAWQDYCGLTQPDWDEPLHGFGDFAWQLTISPVGNFVLNVFLTALHIIVFLLDLIALGMNESDEGHTGCWYVAAVGLFMMNAIAAPLYDWFTLITRTAASIASCCSDDDNNCSDSEITLQFSGNNLI